MDPVLLRFVEKTAALRMPAAIGRGISAAGAQAARAGTAGNQLLGRMGGYEGGLFAKGKSLPRTALHGVESAYLAGLKPDQWLLDSKFGKRLPEAVRENVLKSSLAKVLMRPAPLAIAGTAAAGADAVHSGVQDYNNRYDLMADSAADSIARNAGLTPEQRDDLRANLFKTLQSGQVLDPSALMGLNSKAMTSEQSALMRKVLGSSLRDAALPSYGPVAENKNPSLPMSIYNATRYVSPGAYAAKHIVHGLGDVARWAVGKPYGARDVEADINGYLSKTKGDPSQAGTRLGNAVATGVSDLAASNLNQNTRDVLGHPRDQAFGVPLSNHLEGDVGSVMRAAPESMSRAIFASGGMPITQTINAGKNLASAWKDTRRAANRTVAEGAYDAVRRPLVGDGPLHPAPFSSDPGFAIPSSTGNKGVDDFAYNLPGNINAAAKAVREVPDTTDAPRFARQLQKSPPSWMAPFMPEPQQ